MTSREIFNNWTTEEIATQCLEQAETMIMEKRKREKNNGGYEMPNCDGTGTIERQKVKHE